jgi:hypothetical protein
MQLRGGRRLDHFPSGLPLGDRTKESLPLPQRDKQVQHRHPTLPHGGAGLHDGLRLRPELVEQRDQGGLIVARLRRVIRGARVVRGVSDLVATVTLHDTERAFLPHGASLGSQRLHDSLASHRRVRLVCVALVPTPPGLLSPRMCGGGGRGQRLKKRGGCAALNQMLDELMP